MDEDQYDVDMEAMQQEYEFFSQYDKSQEAQRIANETKKHNIVLLSRNSQVILKIKGMTRNDFFEKYQPLFENIRSVKNKDGYSLMFQAW